MKSPEVLSDSEQVLQSGNAGFPVTVGKGSSSVLNFLKFGTEYQINVWSVTENGEKSFQSTEANVITSELPIFWICCQKKNVSGYNRVKKWDFTKYYVPVV